MHIPKSPLGFYMCPPSFAFYQDLWRPQTRDRGGCNHLEYVPHSGSRNANQLASNQWHIWTPHTEPISEEVWQLVMSLNAHEDEQRCRENHLLGSCEHVQIRLHGRRKLKPPTQCGAAWNQRNCAISNMRKLILTILEQLILR